MTTYGVGAERLTNYEVGNIENDELRSRFRDTIK